MACRAVQSEGFSLASAYYIILRRKGDRPVQDCQHRLDNIAIATRSEHPTVSRSNLKNHIGCFGCTCMTESFSLKPDTITGEARVLGLTALTALQSSSMLFQPAFWPRPSNICSGYNRSREEEGLLVGSSAEGSSELPEDRGSL